MMTSLDSQRQTEAQLKAQKQRPQTRPEELRTLMRTLENRIALLAEIPAQEAREIPYLFDQIDRILAELEQSGMNLASEQGHFETLSAQYKTKRPHFLRKIGGAEELENLRQDLQPSQDRWWWYIDLTLAAEKRQATLRWLKTAGIAVVVLVILVLVYQQFFAPDPIVRESYGHQQRSENALIGGDLEMALAEIQEAIQLTPEDGRLYILQGVIQESLGNLEEARTSFDTALQKYEQPEYFYNERTTVYLMMGDAERALADSEAAIQLNPNSAISYLHRGNAYEILGDIPKAIESLEEADEIAQESGSAQLQAIIRVSLSNVYQRITVPTLSEEESGLGNDE